MPSARWTSHELIPFFALATSQMAVNHLSNPSGLSSITVPILMLNCFPHALLLHRQIRRLAMKAYSLLPQCGQVMPFGQRIGIR